jgi:hypothetical protein
MTEMPPTRSPKSPDLHTVSGSRGGCWRTACQQANGAYRTVEYLRGNVVVARCHHGRYETYLDLLIELAAHAG